MLSVEGNLKVKVRVLGTFLSLEMRRTKGVLEEVRHGRKTLLAEESTIPNRLRGWLVGELDRINVLGIIPENLGSSLGKEQRNQLTALSGNSQGLRKVGTIK